jgi:hypothetical protein
VLGSGFGGLPEGFLIQQFARAVLIAQGQIPVLGKLLGLGQTLLLGGYAAVAAGEIGRALPKAAIIALIDVDLAAENRARGHGGSLRHRRSQNV